jgi:DNA-binding GntR family transcriptional regulator
MPLPENDPSQQFINAQGLAYATLRDWILHGPLRPGEPLRDTDIAKQLGISRTPVREALIRLAQDGLVESARGRGTKVTDLKIEQAPQLFEVGTVLDAYAAEVAATRLEPEDLEQLRDVLKKMEDTHESSLLAEIDRDFHLIYYLRTGNEVLVTMLGQVTNDLMRIERHAWGHADIWATACDEHRALMAAFERGDAKAAAAAATENWRRSWDRIEVLLRSSADGSDQQPGGQDSVDEPAATV